MKAHSDLIRRAVNDGLNMVVDYSGEEYIRVRGYKQAMEAIEAADIANLRLYRGSKYMCAAGILLDGVDEETVYDYTLGTPDTRDDADCNYIERWFNDFFERCNH